jgi:hypothetical protein
MAKLHAGSSAFKNTNLIPNIVKADALSRRPCQEECTHCHKIELYADIKQIRATSTLPAADWDLLVLKTEHPNDTDIRPILREVETGRRSEWKDIAYRSPTYKTYWVFWKSLTIRNRVLERNWGSANGRTKLAQIVLPRSSVEDVLTELHGGPSEGHLGVIKALN